MDQLLYSQSEIEAESEYHSPHIEGGLTLHGGFDAEGGYISPRTKNRWRAVHAWERQLVEAGVDVVSATTALLTEPNFPNAKQQVFLLQNGLEQPLWDSLTITGIVEGRGRALAEFQAPDFQKIIIEDISNLSLGHMNKGLLTAHGWDEGGREGADEGGHDIMWYAVRDLVFGKDKYPLPTPPNSIGREKDEREMEQIPAEYEGLLSLLMNVLMIEVRAEQAFRYYEDVIGNTAVFTDCQENAALAVKLVSRIRQDEAVHVAWLRTAITEFGASTIMTDKGHVQGWDIIGPVWEKMVYWHSVEMHVANREARNKEMEKYILADPNGKQLLEQFWALS